VDNKEGGHHLLDICTGRTIKRQTMTVGPITQITIDLAKKRAENNDMSAGLKIETKSGIILYDSS
jgi:hypothetical protein